MAAKKLKWRKSDSPYDSEFLEGRTCSVRVKPDRRGGFEMTLWKGPEGRRVLHSHRDGVKTRAAAKKTGASTFKACERHG